MNQLALLNLRPEDISQLILSHVHGDHAGNVDLFPDAEIVISEEEYNACILKSRQPGAESFIRNVAERPAEKIRVIRQDVQLFPGIELVRLPGHSYCVLGLITHLAQSGTMIFTSDAVYTSKNWGPPARMPSLIHHIEQFYQSVEKLRVLKDRLSATVIFGHDKEQFLALKKAPEYYE